MSFDTTQPIDLKVASPDAADGFKTVTVNFPTDEQLVERVGKMKTIIRNLGRGKSVTEPQPNEDNDLALLLKIKVAGADLDKYEASQVISRLTRAKVVDSNRAGNKITVTLQAPSAKTVHTLRIPSAKQSQEYGRGVVSVMDGRHGMQEMKLNLQVASDLYDKLSEKSEGYTGPVPVSHKSEVISELMAVINADTDDSEVQGF
jgi:hypothetical protein